MNNHLYDRYQRQILLKEFGTEAQAKLFNAKVLVIGAGGLGCPALQYLAAAGVGTIGIVDFDLIELSNLQRQTLYNTNDIGKHKTTVSAERIKAFNPSIHIQTHTIQLNNTNAYNLIYNYDIVIDGTDNFSTKYLINDICTILQKPLIYGAILRFEGQVSVFNLPNKQNICTNYRDLFATPPLPNNVPTCNEAGVIGVLPGIIGTMQAAEAIKIITNIGEPLCNKILSYNVLNNKSYLFDILPITHHSNNFPTTKAEIENFNYDWHCGLNNTVPEIDFFEFEELRKNEEIKIIDVREEGEIPKVEAFSCINIPLSNFVNEIQNIELTNRVVVFCQHGKRSIKAAQILKAKNNHLNIVSLKGGIVAWEKQFNDSIY